MDEIAELAGISKPMVYLYLDSRRACSSRASAVRPSG
ncbi:hypothetical protein NKH77_10045 [Streptomyces sp. M19]